MSCRDIVPCRKSRPWLEIRSRRFLEAPHDAFFWSEVSTLSPPRQSGRKQREANAS